MEMSNKEIRFGGETFDISTIEGSHNAIMVIAQTMELMNLTFEALVEKGVLTTEELSNLILEVQKERIIDMEGDESDEEIAMA